MAAALFLRGVPLTRLRLHYYRFPAGIIPLRRPWSTTAESSRLEEEVSAVKKTTAVSSARDSLKYPRWDDPDYRKWKDKEDEILNDIESITSLTKEILHSDRYLDGERLTIEDEKIVVEKLLSYHPNSDDKIGSGLDSIMVDRHPQFRNSRCLFVVRTDGGWIDFSYQKCLRAYIRDKYPAYSDKFIREHFKRGS
ncbi:protein DCL, chloroplastic [Euphorbia lathyris]|uniref:protein DCL, chloroplastic n=1 Tax=Euphorbia lathyris TaxID=212925 RepID=UPI00331436AA